MTPSPDPQPCPWCGKADQVRPMISGQGQRYADCARCGIYGPRVNFSAGVDGALAAWNKRSHAPAAATEAAESIAHDLEAGALRADTGATCHPEWLRHQATRVRLLAHPPGTGLGDAERVRAYDALVALATSRLSDSKPGPWLVIMPPQFCAEEWAVVDYHRKNGAALGEGETLAEALLRALSRPASGEGST